MPTLESAASEHKLRSYLRHGSMLPGTMARFDIDIAVHR